MKLTEQQKRDLAAAESNREDDRYRRELQRRRDVVFGKVTPPAPVVIDSTAWTGRPTGGYRRVKLWLAGMWITFKSRIRNLFVCWACKGTGGVRQPTFEPGVYETEECPICRPRFSRFRRWVRGKLWPSYECRQCVGQEAHEGCYCAYHGAISPGGPGAGPIRAWLRRHIEWEC